MPLAFSTIRDGHDVADALVSIFPGLDALAPRVVHPTAVWAGPDGSHVTLKITADTPPSRHDRFVLNTSRAQADGLITTGKNLRDEPTLSPGWLGPEQETAPVADWRRSVLGKTEGPAVLVLTSGRDVDLDHPMFGSSRAILFTGPEAAEDLLLPALERGIETVSHPEPSIARAVAWLRSDGECQVVSIEAGPSTSLALYGPNPGVDELLLSTFEGDLPRALRGGRFLSSEELEAGWNGGPRFRVREDSGPWSFQRWVPARSR